jgi:hypothetical protein
MKFLKTNWHRLALIVLLTWYGHYAGKTNADLWWRAQGLVKPAKYFLIIRQQPDGKTFDPCMITVTKDSVVSIMPDGQISLNQTMATVHNCKFQWVEGQ